MQSLPKFLTGLSVSPAPTPNLVLQSSLSVPTPTFQSLSFLQPPSMATWNSEHLLCLLLHLPVSISSQNWPLPVDGPSPAQYSELRSGKAQLPWSPATPPAWLHMNSRMEAETRTHRPQYLLPMSSDLPLLGRNCISPAFTTLC